jgi:hypothetical protein
MRFPSVSTSGESDHALAVERILFKRRIGGCGVCQRAEFDPVEPHGRRFAGRQHLAEVGALPRTIDEDGVENPWTPLLNRALDSDFGGLPPLAIQRPKIDQERIRTHDEIGNFVWRDRHGRHRARGEQHIGSEILRHRIGDAMDPRAPCSQAHENVRGDTGEVGPEQVRCGRVHLKLPPPA